MEGRSVKNTGHASHMKSIRSPPSPSQKDDDSKHAPQRTVTTNLIIDNFADDCARSLDSDTQHKNSGPEAPTRTREASTQSCRNLRPRRIAQTWNLTQEIETIVANRPTNSAQCECSCRTRYKMQTKNQREH